MKRYDEPKITLLINQTISPLGADGLHAGNSENPEGEIFSVSGATKLDRDGVLNWEKQFTNGFDDDFHQIMRNPNDSFIISGTTRLKDRYEGGKYNFWVLNIDKDGGVKDGFILYESPGAVIDDSGTLFKDEENKLFASWAIQGQGMNDLQHQECVYLIPGQD